MSGVIAAIAIKKIQAIHGPLQVWVLIDRVKNGALHIWAPDLERLEKMWNLLLQTEFAKIMLQIIFPSFGGRKIQTQKRPEKDDQTGHTISIWKDWTDGVRAEEKRAWACEP